MSTTQRTSAWRRLRAHRSARWSMGLLAAMSLLAFLTPLLPFAAPATPRLERKLAAPTLWPLWEQGFERDALDPGDGTAAALADARVALFGPGQIAPLFGTDAVGRCVLSRTFWGARVSLSVALVASVISLVIGVLYGGVAGSASRRVDAVMMRAVDFLYALPLMFIVIFVVAFLRAVRQQDPENTLSQEIVLFAVIGAVSWLIMARVVRARVLSLRQAEFVVAARATGCSPLRLLLRHLLPNASPVALVTLTLTVPRVMLLEAFLSFLGLGVEAPAVSWGVLARHGFDAITAVHVSWWLIFFPGVALGLTLLALNLLGDGLRDVFDPRLQGAERAP